MTANGRPGMMNLLIRVSVAVIALYAPIAVAAQSNPPAEPRLIRIPTASMVPTGSTDLHYDVLRDPGIFPGADRQRNFTFSLGFVPRLTLMARGTVAEDSLTGLDIARDLSAGLQFLLVEQGGWRPALAIGFPDVGGAASNFRTRYVVLSKNLFQGARATLGYGAGPDVLEGPFGGVELALGRAVTLFGEYDTDAFNSGVRLLPFPESWEKRGIPRPSLDFIFQHGRNVSLGVGLRTLVGAADRIPPKSSQRTTQYRRADDSTFVGLSLQTVSERLQAELISRGLENVRVAIAQFDAGLTVAVDYENRTYNRSELDALGMVLGVTALRTPASVTQLRVIVKELNIPVLEVGANVSSFLAFVNEQQAPGEFAEELRITQHVGAIADAAQPLARTPIAQRSWLKLDLFLRPRVETAVLTEWGVVDARFSVLPEGQVQLTPGAFIQLRAAVPVARSRNYPGELGTAVVERALLQQAVRLPLGPFSKRAAAFTQFSAGRYTAEHVGVGNELVFSLGDGAFLGKGMFARLGPSYNNLNRWVALGNARVRYPAWDLTMSATAGQFLDGDRGFSTDISRFFGNTETGVFFRHSERGSLAGIRVAMPLTVTKELSPRRVRLRLPDVYSYEQRSIVLADRNEIRADIARVPSTDHEIERVYWDRDRLHGEYIRRHVEALRNAAIDLVWDDS